MRVIDYLVKALYAAGVSAVLIPEDSHYSYPTKLTADARDRFEGPVYIDDDGYLATLDSCAPPALADTAIKKLASRILSAVELRRRGWWAEINEDVETDGGPTWSLDVYDREGENPVHTVIFYDAYPDPTADEIEAALLRFGWEEECIGRESTQTETRNDKGTKT